MDVARAESMTFVGFMKGTLQEMNVDMQVLGAVDESER